MDNLQPIRSYTSLSNNSRPSTVPSTFTMPPKPVLKREQTSFANGETSKYNEHLWRENVKNSIQLNNHVMNNSDKHIYLSKNEDPLTNLRDVLRTLSNAEAFKYMRQCRLTVGKLRACWVEVNEEIKSLVKNKEYLQSALEHVRKDIIINNETIENRVKRPPSEPLVDSVDDMLQAERKTLFLIKKNFEIMLKPLQEYIFKLDAIRETVFRLCQERAVVTDLICQCITQSIRSYDRATLQKQNSSPKVTQSLQDFNLKSGNTGGNSGEKSNKSGLQVGPLNAFTPEIIEIIKEAAKRIDEARNLRTKSRGLMKECFEKITNANKIVDSTFIKKLEENLLLSKNLAVSSAENQLANNRAVRWHDLNEIAYKYSIGPEKSTNLNLYEKLERPIIKTFQKHPGNQVPEAQEIHKGTSLLKDSVETSQNHIKTLRIIGQRLDSSTKQKEAQYALDSSLLRKRKELSSHKWVPITYVK